MSDNWIVANLQNAFNTWNAKMAEIWSLVTTSPQDFKDGAIWNIVEGINGGLQGKQFSFSRNCFLYLPFCKVFASFAYTAYAKG